VDHTAGPKAGEPVRDIKNGFHRAVELAEVKDFTWHDLRHTFASWLTMRGASLRSVAELLGSAEVGLLDPPALPAAKSKRARKGQRLGRLPAESARL
jgi:integrase